MSSGLKYKPRCVNGSKYTNEVWNTQKQRSSPLSAMIMHTNLSNWKLAKAEYQKLIAGEKNTDIMQTYFNSSFCSFFNHRHIREDFTFFPDEQEKIISLDISSIICEFPIKEKLSTSVKKLLNQVSFNLHYRNIDNDCTHIVSAIKKNLISKLDKNEHIHSVQYLPSLFFRNKAAYLAGRICTSSTIKPFVLAFVNKNKEIIVDTVLFSNDEVSKVFSFTRSYFMVDARYPSLYVSFLKSIIPKKEIFELYTMLGFAKHGKTIFFYETVKYTKFSTDQYTFAPGIKGMVMSVFTLPSLDYVYKLMKDKFTPPKSMTQQQVKEKYKLVKRHDRVGRMADTFEFRNLAFDVRKFSDSLLEELYHQAASKLTQKGNALIIEHIYVERRMIPLNLYLSSASDEDCELAMQDYGLAIKQLAAANIFPGDMLLKNFGVTRHGRVVFYDYDEVCLLTECNFRDIPKPKNEEQEFASQPWYSIDEFDIFPEEFSLFFSGNKKAKAYFEIYHSDLYRKEFWQEQQERIRQGDIPSVYPYKDSLRFGRIPKK